MVGLGNHMHSLIIMARQPIPGQTKTRLCPPLTASQAAELYACFLRDVLDITRQVRGATPLITYAPESAGPFFAALAPDIATLAQQGANLGERLDYALSTQLTSGGARLAAAVSSDNPNLPPALIEEAFARLAAGADLVLGPAEDGGYYLIGMRSPQPRLLREVQMSTPRVLDDTLTLAGELGLRSELLAPWYDVDSIADLRRLHADLAAAPANVAPATRRFLEGM